MKNDWLHALHRILDAAKGLGSRRLENGTELIGPVPHVAPEAWLHITYSPLTEEQIEEVGHQAGRAVPEDYRQFLRRMNGLKLFSGALSLYGLRANFRRTGDDAWQPFSIGAPNTLERPRDAKAEMFFIGGYRSDGSLLYIDPSTSHVHRCARDSVASLNEWSDLWTFLVEEAERLASLFDERGRRIDSRTSTAPLPEGR